MPFCLKVTKIWQYIRTCTKSCIAICFRKTTVYRNGLYMRVCNSRITGDKNISILHSPCRTSDLQFSLVLQTHALVLKNCMGGGRCFEVPYITAKIIFTHCSQFHNCIPYTDKKSFTFNTQSHVATFFSQNRVYFRFLCRRHFSRTTTVKKKIQ